MTDGTPEPPPDEATERLVAVIKLRWKRVSLLFVGFVAVGFIGISIEQIIPDVFGTWVHPLPPASPGSPARICAEGIRDLAKALNRARGTAGGPGFGKALQPEWNDVPRVEQACARSSEGLDAWAALLRLRSGEEQLVGQPGDPLTPLQQAVASHLPADLR